MAVPYKKWNQVKQLFLEHEFIDSYDTRDSFVFYNNEWMAVWDLYANLRNKYLENKLVVNALLENMFLTYESI